MPALLALLSLLGACSGMLDLPDQPQVSMETTTAPLEPTRRHDTRDGDGAWREPAPWVETAGASSGETLGPSAADAGVDEPEDGGLDVRLSSG